jgi:Homeodomain-like domain-containing protein
VQTDTPRGQDVAPPHDEDAALACLLKIAIASGALHGKTSQFTGVIDQSACPHGAAYGELVPLRTRLDLVREISDALRDLTTCGHVFRRLEARALYAEGMTVAQLAKVFGVSRQRVSALLRGPDGDLTASPAD